MGKRAKRVPFKTHWPLWVVCDFAGGAAAAFMDKTEAERCAQEPKGRTVTLCHAVFTPHKLVPKAGGKRGGK